MNTQAGEPFVFICYAHKDSEQVHADLNELEAHGVRFWYDEGIPAGVSWRAEIATAIEGAERFLFYVSRESLQSANCIREVEYALDHDVDIVPIYLEDCPLPPELGLALNRVQALFRDSGQNYTEHLLEAARESVGVGAWVHGERRQIRWWLPLALIATVVFSLLIWKPWSDNGLVDPTQDMTSFPSAQQRYLDGLELMGRWDKADNLEKAIGLFSEAVQINPDFALAYARLAEGYRLRYVLTGDESLLEQARVEADKAIGLNPNLAPVQVASDSVNAALGNQDLAFAAVERAMTIDPNNASANQTMAKLLERQGRIEDAEAAFERAVVLAPEDLVIRDSWANFLYRRGRFEEAADQWRAVIQVAPDHFGALVNLGTALSETGDIEGSVEMYLRAIEIRPSYMAYSNLGTAYFRTGNYPDAVSAFQAALEIDDTGSLAWGNLALTYDRMEGKGAEADQAFDRAIDLAETVRRQDPRDPWVHSDLALYYAKTGQFDRAVERLNTAIVLSPDSGEILAAAAEALELTGNRDRAVEVAMKSLQNGFPIQRFHQSPELSELLRDPRMQTLP
jgi:tetratricopeptide (TPR) repeat protein